MLVSLKLMQNQELPLFNASTEVKFGIEKKNLHGIYNTISGVLSSFVSHL